MKLRSACVLAAIALFALPVIAYAQQNVPAGGTGLQAVPSGAILVGDSQLRLKATTSPTVGYITATSGTSTLPRVKITTAIELLGEYITNLTTWFSTKADTWFATKSTTNLAEGTNLYYTSARDVRFSTTSTDYYKAQNNFYSTTSTGYDLSTYPKGYFFSTTSVAYWENTQSRWATTSADYHLSSKDKGYFFSTTSAAAYLASFPQSSFSTTSATYFTSLGLSYSTTSADAWLSTKTLSAFSTTSADFWKTQRDFFSTTSASFFSSRGLAHSTTSDDAWLATKSTNNLSEGTNLYYTTARDIQFSTTSVAYYLAQFPPASFSTTSASFFATLGLAHSTTSTAYQIALYDKGFFFSTTSTSYFLSQFPPASFSTTSAAYFASLGLAFSTTSATAHIATFDKGYFFSTTSANIWAGVGLGFSTTSADTWKSLRNFFSTTSADYHLSTKGYLTGNQTITLTGDISGSGTTGISTTILPTITHWWTALQNTTNASTSQLTATSSVWLTSLATPSGTILAVDPTGKIIATTTSTGGVASVTATAPAFSTGGTNPNITVFGLATTSQPASSNLLVSNGSNGVYPVATTSGTVSAPLTGSITCIGGCSLGIQQGTGLQSGYISSADWGSFNSRLSSSTIGLLDKGFFHSTTSSAYFTSVGLSFSTTSTDFWKTQNSFFSTTSASVFSAAGLAFSTTSSNYWETQQTARNADDLTNNSIEDLNDVATMSEMYGDILGWNGSSWTNLATTTLFNTASPITTGILLSGDWTRFNQALSTTSLGLIDKGYFFSTTSASNFLAQNTGNAFSTTSALFFSSVGLGHSTTSAAYQLTQPVILGNATATTFFATTASSTNSFASTERVGSSTIGSLTIVSTTTSANGFNIAAGCFAVNGTCLTSGGGGGVTGGTAGMLAAWTSATTLTSTGTPTFASFVSTSTATSTIAGALSIQNFIVGTSTTVCRYPEHCTYQATANTSDVAINAAIASLGSAGGTVYIKAGTYTLNAPILINVSGIVLQGQGNHSTIIIAKNSLNDYMVKVNDAALRERLEFRNFKLDGNRTNQTTGGCIVASSTARSTFDTLWLESCYGQALKLTGPAAGGFGYNNTISNNFINNHNVGIEMINNDENQIYANTINSSITYGVYDRQGLQNIHDNVFTGVLYNTGVGIYSEYTVNTSIQGNTFDTMPYEAIYLLCNSVQGQHLVTDNYIFKADNSGAGRAAITVDGCTRNKITNNYTDVWLQSYAYREINNAPTNTYLSDNFFYGTTSATLIMTGSGSQSWFNISTTTPSGLLYWAQVDASGQMGFNTPTGYGQYFAINGAQKWTVASNGNVGISTSTPGSLLAIGSTSGINFTQATSSFSSTGGIDLKAGCFSIAGTCVGGASLTGTTGQFPYFSGTNTAVGTSSLFLTTARNILIGTTTDQSEKLSIQGTGGNIFGAYNSVGTQRAYINDTGDLYLLNGAMQLQSQLLFNSAVYTQIQANQPNINLNFKTVTGTGSIVFTPNAIDLLTVNANNRVGISTSTPFAKLAIFASTTDAALPNLFLIASSTPASNANMFTVDNAGRVSIATSTFPALNAMFSVGSSTRRNVVEATTTIFLDSASKKGTCIVMKDADGTGYSYLQVNNGVLTVGTANCQ